MNVLDAPLMPSVVLPPFRTTLGTEEAREGRRSGRDHRHVGSHRRDDPAELHLRGESAVLRLTYFPAVTPG
jgi:hypothetical protein